MSEQQQIDRFAWHPAWSGRSPEAVRVALIEEIASDQRAYELALSGADIHENNALASVVALDRKWGGLAMDWAAADPALLADAMLRVELERERRRDLISPAELGVRVDIEPGAPEPDDFPEKSLRLTDPTWRFIALVVVLAIFGLFAYWVLR
jgi:hypothetical protein